MSVDDDDIDDDLPHHLRVQAKAAGPRRPPQQESDQMQSHAESLSRNKAEFQDRNSVTRKSSRRKHPIIMILVLFMSMVLLYLASFPIMFEFVLKNPNAPGALRSALFEVYRPFYYDDYKLLKKYFSCEIINLKREGLIACKTLQELSHTRTVALNTSAQAKSIDSCDFLGGMKTKVVERNEKAVGVMLTAVPENSKYRKMGLRTGDIIRSVDGEEPSSESCGKIQRSVPGSTFKILIERGNKNLMLRARW